MSPRPPPKYSHSESEDSDVAPEAITLSKSKQASRAKEQAVHAFKSEQKAKRKRENKEKDRALKEAKEKRRADAGEDDGERKTKRAKTSAVDKRKGKAKSERMDPVERMELAMLQAAEERTDDEEQSEEEEEWGGIDPSNHLPDYLFSAAATAPSAPQPKEKSFKSATKAFLKHPKSIKIKAKDLIVGSRTVRTINANSLSTTSLTLPPDRVNKFLKRTLQLKNGKSTKDTTALSSEKKPGGKGKASVKSQSWERRAANVGVLRNPNGPALKFVRGS